MAAAPNSSVRFAEWLRWNILLVLGYLPVILGKVENPGHVGLGTDSTVLKWLLRCRGPMSEILSFAIMSVWFVAFLWLVLAWLIG